MGRSEGLKRHKYITIIKLLKLCKQVCVLSIRIVKSNVSSVGRSGVGPLLKLQSFVTIMRRHSAGLSHHGAAFEFKVLLEPVSQWLVLQKWTFQSRRLIIHKHGESTLWLNPLFPCSIGSKTGFRSRTLITNFSLDLACPWPSEIISPQSRHRSHSHNLSISVRFEKVSTLI